MKGTRIDLDDDDNYALRRAALERGVSARVLAASVVKEWLKNPPDPEAANVEQVGRDRQRLLVPKDDAHEVPEGFRKHLSPIGDPKNEAPVIDVLRAHGGRSTWAQIEQEAQLSPSMRKAAIASLKTKGIVVQKGSRVEMSPSVGGPAKGGTQQNGR